MSDNKSWHISILILILTLAGIAIIDHFDPGKNPQTWMLTKLQNARVEIVDVPRETLESLTTVTNSRSEEIFMTLIQRWAVGTVNRTLLRGFTNYCNVYWFTHEGLIYQVIE